MMRRLASALLLALLSLASRSSAGGGGGVEATHPNSWLDVGANNGVDAACHREFPLTCTQQLSDPRGLGDFTRFMVVVAHPDDAATCAAGTVAMLTGAGGTGGSKSTKNNATAVVRYVVMTSGDKGTSNRSMTGPELAKIREREQRAAAAVLGVASVDFLGISDGELVDTEQVRGELTRLVRTYRPQVLLTWDPQHDVSLYRDFLEHRDHRAAGQIALDVAYPTARDFLYFPEQVLHDGLEPWDVEQVYLFSWRWWPGPLGQNYVVDITGTMPLKIKSMLCHKSQVGKNVAGEIAYLEHMGAALAGASPAANISAVSAAGTNPDAKEEIRGHSSSPFVYAEWFKRVLMPASVA